MSINQYDEKIKEYSALKQDILKIIENLSLSVDNCNNFNSVIKNKYAINNEYTPIYTRTKVLENNMNDTCNYLKRTIIPNIDNMIFMLERAKTLDDKS